MECHDNMVNVSDPTARFSAADLPTIDNDTQSLLVDQPFATSEMGGFDGCGFVARMFRGDVGGIGTHR